VVHEGSASRQDSNEIPTDSPMFLGHAFQYYYCGDCPTQQVGNLRRRPPNL